MKKIYSVSIVCLCLLFSLQGNTQCATNAYQSAGGNCISLSWTPASTIPAQLPVSLVFNGDLYAYTNGSGDIGFPAVYKKTNDICQVPSELVNGNITINLFNNISYTCQFPSGTLLAIHDLSFTAMANGQKNMLVWSVKNDNTTKNFEAQRSADGRSFSALNTMISKELSAAGTASYAYSDEQPLTTTFYRVKVISKDGTNWFSKVIKLQNDNAKNALLIYPNPNKGSFTITGISSAELKSLDIYDVQGRKLSFRSTNMNDANKSVSIAVKGNSTGVFFVQYVSDSQKMHTRFLVQ